jgi:hypothetical protein
MLQNNDKLREKIEELESKSKIKKKSNPEPDTELKVLQKKFVEDKIQKTIYELSNLIMHNEMLRTYQVTFLKQINELKAQYDKSIELIANNNVKISKVSKDLEINLEKYQDQL